MIIASVNKKFELLLVKNVCLLKITSVGLPDFSDFPHNSIGQLLTVNANTDITDITP